MATTSTTKKIAPQPDYAVIGPLISKGFYSAKGVAMTPATTSSWKGKDGNPMFMSKQTLVCGVSTVTLMSMGDSENELSVLDVGTLVQVHITNSKTEKGAIQIMGEVEILTPETF